VRRALRLQRRLAVSVLLVFSLTFLGAMIDQNRTTSLLNSIMSGSTWPVVPVSWKLKLMQTNGSGTANGTELTGATGYTAGGATMTAWTTISGTTANITGPVAAVSWTNSGATWTAVAGIEIWDTAGTPLRWFWGPLSGGAVTVNAGNTLQFAIGSIGLNGVGW
jgi:hypothetical protein